MKIRSQITLLFSGRGATLEIHDKTAGSLIFCAELSPSQTCQVLARLAQVSVTAEAFPEVIGKRQKYQEFVFPVPETDYKIKKETAIQHGLRLCPVGWEMDTYFGSQNSFFKQDGQHFARTMIRRWVECAEEDRIRLESHEDE